MKAILETGEKQQIIIDSFRFDCGARLENLELCYETWGSYRGDNAILITHALTGTSHVAAGNGRPGWWQNLVGPGCVFDTERYFIICANVIGGCSGSSGPASLNPITGKPYGTSFPVITIRDMVRAARHLLDELGVSRLRSVAGGSMGAMQAMEWAALYPEIVDSIVIMAAPGRAYPQSIAYRKTQRQAIMLDPAWNNGNYYESGPPLDGIELARQMGFITYRSEKHFAERFGRQFADKDFFDLHARFEIEAYLQHHGRKLGTWFDANTYLYLSKAMDLFDLGLGCSSFAEGVRRIKAPACVIGFDSDLLFPLYQQKEIADLLAPYNPRVSFHEVKTEFGHDAFLLETEQLSNIVGDFLNQNDI